LQYFGTPESIWRANAKELTKVPFINAMIYGQILNDDARRRSEEILKELSIFNIDLVGYNDPSYPVKLREIYDPPVALYIKGKLIADEPMIAVVGSRKADSYGRDVAHMLAYEIANCGITVVSGMARGIDSFAHSGAINAGGRTAAITGCGLDTVYPPENKKMSTVIERTGVLISEYPPGMSPLPPNFIARNRIISGLSSGVLIVQAGRKSGSLITANYALEQGREVFAVPGNITSRNSAGTNALIRDGAKIVTHISDILEELGPAFAGYGAEESDEKFKKTNYPNLSKEEKMIVNCLESGRMSLDMLSDETGIKITELNRLLLFLEMKGLICQFPGRKYENKTDRKHK
ncbi:MAG: DNA-processing protein DprA, partial [Eubacteriales bacterium]|nr:DNA-processing protein DprA [Eubacteriales bacterium]